MRGVGPGAAKGPKAPDAAGGHGPSRAKIDSPADAAAFALSIFADVGIVVWFAPPSKDALRRAVLATGRPVV
jgi:hypothetical protein